jgi:hypothetical protein
VLRSYAVVTPRSTIGLGDRVHRCTSARFPDKAAILKGTSVQKFLTVALLLQALWRVLAARRP